MVDYITDKIQVNLKLLKEYVKSTSEDFIPPLVGRVDIDTWTEKIYNNGYVILSLFKGTIVGAIFFYANDEINKMAYVSYLSVNSEFRSQGIASELLRLCFHKSSENGMTEIGVHTHNPKALRLYQKIGFEVHEQVRLTGCDLIKTYLVKQL